MEALGQNEKAETVSLVGTPFQQSPAGTPFQQTQARVPRDLALVEQPSAEQLRRVRSIGENRVEALGVIGPKKAEPDAAHATG